METWNRVGWGSLGALAAILTSVMSLDLDTVRDGWDKFDVVAGIFYSFKYAIVLMLGGFIALLRDGERDKANLVAMGASAPTILVTLFNSQAAAIQ